MENATQSELRTALQSWSGAMQKKDIDRLMAFYSPEVVYFDVVPPLRYVGAAAVRRNFQRWFDGWNSDIGVEISDLRIAGSGDTATAYLLHRTSGTLKDGREVGYWVRVTVCWQRSNQKWSIVHEHVSLPVEIKSGKVVMDLTP